MFNTQLNDLTVLFQGIQLSISHLFVLSVIDTFSCYQSGPGSDGNKELLCIPQSFSITGASPSDCLVSYPGHSLEEGSYLSAEKQLMYSTAPANWAGDIKCHWVQNLVIGSDPKLKWYLMVQRSKVWFGFFI